jgi:hypothetical protein
MTRKLLLKALLSFFVLIHPLYSNRGKTPETLTKALSVAPEQSEGGLYASSESECNVTTQEYNQLAGRYNKCRELLKETEKPLTDCKEVLEEVSKQDCKTDYVPWGISGGLGILLIILLL